MLNNDITARIGIEFADTRERFHVASGIEVREGSEDTALLEAQNVADAAVRADAHFEYATTAADEFQEVEAVLVDNALILAQDAVELSECAVCYDKIGDKDD